MQELNVVDENDNVIGKDTRENIHKDGLLHREIAIWIFNNKEEIIFQKRSLTKEKDPGLLSGSCAGHVDENENYDQAAIRELEEETGIRAKKEDLIFLEKFKIGDSNSRSNSANNHFKKVYAYHFTGKSADLKIEEGEATSLEFWPIDKVLNLNEEEKKEFVSTVADGVFTEIFKKIKKLSAK
ncbi:MAG TPA: NUDIX domain-containing protein [Candidatus Moranbacteria bacterium]|nr:NUDIX domain-containing protein [Candidatus Moranbacteria bacterium]